MLKEYLSSIANKFRDVLGTTEPINAQDFVDKIEETKRYSWNEGMGTGYNHGLEEGKKAEYDAFWDSFQQNGTRTAYDNGFSGVCWNSENFKPKHKPMKVVNGSYMFSLFDAQCKKKSVVIDENIIDFTNITNAQGMFQNFNASVIKMNVIPIKLSNMYSFTLMNNIARHSIEELKLGIHETMSFDTNSFHCGSLKNVSFVEGSVIGKSIWFQGSPKLTHDSLVNIINVLKNYNGTGTTNTLTLHADAKSKLTETDIANITQKGWTIA